MFESKVSEEEKIILEKVIKRYRFSEDVRFSYVNGSFKLHLTSSEIADELRGLCSDFLVESGFNQDYSPNQDGVVLEALIDLLFIDS